MPLVSMMSMASRIQPSRLLPYVLGAALGAERSVERLAAFLLHLSARQQRRGGREHHVDLPMTRADIGDHLGLTIETVSRSFSRLKQEGALYFEHPHHIELRDPSRLRELAGQ